MEFLTAFLPIVIYLLLIVILIVGIILGIRCLNTLQKIEKVVDDVNEKVQSLNGFFQIIDFTTDKIVSFTDKIVDAIAFIGTKVFFGRKNKKVKDLEREE